MYVWKKKVDEKDMPPAPQLPKVPDDASWHIWESNALDLFSSGDLDNSVDYMIQAIDRFDGGKKDMERSFAKISQTVVDFAATSAMEGRALPLVKIGLIDEEMRVKHPGVMEGTYLYDLLSSGIERKMEACAGPGELTLLSNDLVFLMMGFLWCSADVREDIDRTARVAETCYAHSLRAKGMKKGTVKMLPKEAVKYLGVHADFAESLKAALVKATSEMSEEDLEQLADHRSEHPVDLIDCLLDALDAANHTSVKGSITRAKAASKWQESVDLFAAQKASFD